MNTTDTYKIPGPWAPLRNYSPNDLVIPLDPLNMVELDEETEAILRANLWKLYE